MIYNKIQLYKFILINKFHRNFQHDPIIIPFSPLNKEYDNLYAPTY
jgi:hypothetical protein